MYTYVHISYLLTNNNILDLSLGRVKQQLKVDRPAQGLPKRIKFDLEVTSRVSSKVLKGGLYRV